MQLTEHFSLEEMTYSKKARYLGIPNEPNAEQLVNLTRLACCVLEPARLAYGKPMTVTSGLRCEELNTLVGGKPTSQHPKGEAADITATDLDELFAIMAQIPHDQLLFEHNALGTRWLHVSYKCTGNRNQTIADYDASK